MFVFNVDAPDTAEPVDLHDQLRSQYGPGRRIESLPIFTTLASNEVALTVIRVTIDGRYRHQLYAVTDATWSLTGLYILYTNALRELLRWRRYIAQGGTVAAWCLEHPEGVYPEQSGLPLWA
jgi:hypothetical protein